MNEDILEYQRHFIHCQKPGCHLEQIRRWMRIILSLHYCTGIGEQRAGDPHYGKDIVLQCWIAASRL